MRAQVAALSRAAVVDNYHRRIPLMAIIVEAFMPSRLTRKQETPR
ncbi:hypothetical protein [Rhodococcus erythropolis]